MTWLTFLLLVLFFIWVISPTFERSWWLQVGSEWHRGKRDLAMSRARIAVERAERAKRQGKNFSLLASRAHEQVRRAEAAHLRAEALRKQAGG
jgi:hypothetical protein